jgi:polyhydroxyalkanoate synthesis regulator phasin
MTGVHLGIGLAALAVESARRLGAEAVERGAVLEKSGRESLAAFERDKLAEMKEYLKRDGRRSEDTSVEAKVEQALATFDVPTRDDIRELHQHLASLGEKINRLQST